MKFDVVAKANKLLHSKGLKQLPMHDNASLHKADFDELVLQARKQVLEKGENVFRPLYTMLTGQTIQDSGSKGGDDAVSPKASEVSAFFAPHPSGNAYMFVVPPSFLLIQASSSSFLFVSLEHLHRSNAL